MSEQIGILERIAGNADGTPGLETQGLAINSALNCLVGVVVDASNNLYITDCLNNVVEKLIPTDIGYILTVIAGNVNGVAGLPTNGPALDSLLNEPCGVDIDKFGNIYVTDFNNNVVEKLIPSDKGYILQIIAGSANGEAGFPTDGPALNSLLNQPSNCAVDNLGNVYIADFDNNVIEKLIPTQDGYMLKIIAGTGTAGLPIEGLALNSPLHGPGGVEVDDFGNLYVADFYNNVIEKLMPTDKGYILSVIAGQQNGDSGLPTEGPALESCLFGPYGVCIDALQNLYVADSSNNILERLVPSNSGYILKIVAGNANGTPGLPTNGNALNSALYSPADVAVDSLGNLYIGDSLNNIVEKVTFIPPIVCFKEDTQILTNDGYKHIQNLKKGDLVKTLKHGYKPIVHIAKRVIYHMASNYRIKDQLYKYDKNTFEDLVEDLVLTGGHSILVDELTSLQQEQTKTYWNDLLKTEDKYRLLAVLDERASVYEPSGNYTVYHFALENEDIEANYGVYANGLLVESCSEKYLKEQSNMEQVL